MTNVALVILFSILLLPALPMVFIPFLPAFWYLLAIAALFGAIDGFVHLTVSNFLVLVALFLASLAVDWSAGLLGAKVGGAAWRSLLFGAIGAAIGLALLPPLGTFAGLFLGVLVSELARQREAPRALRAAGGALLGSMTGIALNALLAFLFVALFFVYALQ